MQTGGSYIFQWGISAKRLCVSTVVIILEGGEKKNFKLAILIIEGRRDFTLREENRLRCMLCQMNPCAAPYSTHLTVLGCLIDQQDYKSTEYGLFLLQSWHEHYCC